MTISSVENQNFGNCSLYETNVYHVVFPETIFLSWDLEEQPMPSKSSIKRFFINELINDHRTASRKNLNLSAVFSPAEDETFYVSSLQESYKDAIISLVEQRKIEFIRTDFPLLFLYFYLPKFSIFDLKKPLQFQEYGTEIDRVFLMPNNQNDVDYSLDFYVMRFAPWTRGQDNYLDNSFTLLPYHYFKPFEDFMINNFLDIKIDFHPQGIYIPDGYLKKYSMSQVSWLKNGQVKNDY